MTTIPAAQLARVLVEVSDTLVDEFDLLEFLQMLADRAAGLVDASAVGLMLSDQRGDLQFMAASTENARMLELFQLQTREGPCLDAFRTGTAVVNVDLAAAGSAWPRFASRATAAGFRSVHTFPLRLRSKVIGAMNVFGTDAGHLDDAVAQILQALADVASISILQERAVTRAELLTEQLQRALNSRIVIEQAKGAVAEMYRVDVDTAFTMIRAHARRTHRGLIAVARALITDRGRLAELAADRDAPPS